MRRTSLLAFLLLAAHAAAQIPCFDTNLGANLGLGDEAVSPAMPLGFTFTYNGVGYSSVQVCSNGYVLLGTAVAAPDWSPSHYELLFGSEVRICPLWMDFDPAAPGSGGVHANAVPASGGNPAYFSVTWNGTYAFGGTTPHTVQVLLIDGGRLQFHHGADLDLNTNDWLFGISQGSGAVFNHVDFGTLPIATGSNPTVHQHGYGPQSFAGGTTEWTRAGAGWAITRAAGCAGRSRYGVGCVGAPDSVYEHFQITRGMDLANSSLSFLLSGSNYLLTPGTAVFAPPGPNASSLGLGDDTETSVSLSAALPYPGGTTTSLNVHSNGVVSTASHGGLLYQPTPSDFLAWANASWCVWHDFVPNAGGNVLFEEIGGVAYLTWNDVSSYQGTNPSTTTSKFQFQFELGSGNWHLVFQNMDSTSVSAWLGADGYVVGFSPAGSSFDFGSTNLSALGVAQLALPEQAPLTLRAAAPAVLGSVVPLAVEQIPAGTPFGAVLFGFVQFQPGLPLAGIGMPDCFRYNDGAASALLVAPGATANQPFPVPANGGLVGFTVHCQAATFSPPLTPLGAIASNGVGLRLGL